MDKELEKTKAEIVRRKVREKIKPLGFQRTKPSYYTRLLEDKIQFIHLHKFSFGFEFRVHTGVRWLVDDFEAVALNGIDTDDFGSKYNLSYHISDESIENCANEILLFVQNEALPWFEKWSIAESSYTEKDKQIKAESILNLIKQSKSLLGIKD